MVEVKARSKTSSVLKNVGEYAEKSDWRTREVMSDWWLVESVNGKEQKCFNNEKEARFGSTVGG